jgi:hypothetical protein
VIVPLINRSLYGINKMPGLAIATEYLLYGEILEAATRYSTRSQPAQELSAHTA